MSYQYSQWKQRLGERSDLSSSLVHLTRSAVVEEVQMTAVDMLIKILREGKLKGSNPRTAFISGDRPAVCFQDAPLASIAENIAFEKRHFQERNRYSGCGLIFSKQLIYNKGGRPVIYDQTNAAKKYITDESEHWRIVSFDLSDTSNVIDWTHEREWRLPGDLLFDLKSTAILIDTRTSYQEFVSKCAEIQEPKILQSICGIIVLDSLLM